MVPTYLCRACWAGWIVDEMNVLPSLTKEERESWKEDLKKVPSNG